MFTDFETDETECPETERDLALEACDQAFDREYDDARNDMYALWAREY